MKVSRIKMFLRGKIFQLLCLIIIVLAIAYINLPGMFNIPNFRQIMNNITITAVFVCGIAPLLMCGGIDFSGSAIGACAGMIIGSCFQWFPSAPWWLMFIPALLMGAIIGALNAFFIIKLNLMAFIATMAMGTIWSGAAVWFVKNVPIPIAVRPFNNLSATFVLNIVPLFFLIAVVLLILYSFLLAKTSFGRSVLMAGGNPTAARLAGLNPNKIRAILFINSGVTAGFAGVINVSQTRQAAPNAFVTSMPHMTAFIASILGGVSFFGGAGSLTGAFMGVALINLLSYTLTAIGVDLWVNGLINGMLLIIALTIDDVTRRIRLNRLGIKAGANSMVMPGMPTR